jgi:hypothetical protein
MCAIAGRSLVSLADEALEAGRTKCPVRFGCLGYEGDAHDKEVHHKLVVVMRATFREL